MMIQPDVAGKFYAKDSNLLRHDILEMLAIVANKAKMQIPKAIIVPHAGYVYSGPIAASAYACLEKAKNSIKRVIIIAPTHYHQINGIAKTEAEFYLTPLGKIAIDQESIKSLDFSFVQVLEEAFVSEHSIEVQLPFLQIVLEKFSLVPLLVGSATIAQVEQILEKLWGGPENLFIISSDLSHYYKYNLAKTLDKKTAEAILSLNSAGFLSEHACGAIPIKGLLAIAAKKKMKVMQVDLRNSGDTAGSKDQVVGYGAFHFYE
jgi:MEMO1 family protein